MMSQTHNSPIDQLINPHYWLALSWLDPIIKNSPLPLRRVCILCLCARVWVSIYDGGCHSSLDYWEVRKEMEGGGGLNHCNTQRRTHRNVHTRGREVKAEGQKFHCMSFFSFFFFYIYIGWPFSYTLPPSLFPPAFFPSSFFLVADLSWVKHKR